MSIRNEVIRAYFVDHGDPDDGEDVVRPDPREVREWLAGATPEPVVADHPGDREALAAMREEVLARLARTLNQPI